MYSRISANKRKSIALIIVFIGFVLFIGWYLGTTTESGLAGVATAGVMASVMTFIGYFSGDKVALWSAGARGPITKEQNPYVYRMVENLTITAGLPMPAVYIIPDQSLNAFATGRDPKHASIALTEGLIATLENEELEGVIAHELSHIGNFDIRLMMLVTVLAGILVLMADMFWRFRIFGGSRRNSSREQTGGIFLVLGLIGIILAPLAAQLIKFAVSRKREFLADASGALLTRYPEGLARALEKIQSHSEPMARANNATAHLYISNPFGLRSQNGLARLFSTHPPLEARIAALRDMTV